MPFVAEILILLEYAHITNKSTKMKSYQCKAKCKYKNIYMGDEFLVNSLKIRIQFKGWVYLPIYKVFID